MKTILILLLFLPLTVLGFEKLKLDLKGDQFTVSFKDPKCQTKEALLEMVISDKKGNVVREVIGGKIIRGRLMISTQVNGVRGDHTLSMRLCPLDPEQKFHIESWPITFGEKATFRKPEKPKPRGKVKVPAKVKAAYAARVAERALPPAPPVVLVRPPSPRIGAPR